MTVQVNSIGFHLNKISLNINKLTGNVVRRLDFLRGIWVNFNYCFDKFNFLKFEWTYSIEFFKFVWLILLDFPGLSN